MKKNLAGWILVLFSLLQPSCVLAADRTEMLLSAPWHGSYVCNQGLTRMQLNLRPIPGAEVNGIEADFVFSADPDNPAVPKGSFRLKGTLNRKEGTLALKQDRWLEPPDDPSYRMVDLEGRLMVGENQATIQGRITTFGCQDFTVWQFYVAPQVGR